MTTGRPPAELLFGRNIRFPIDLVLPDPRRKQLQAQAAQQRAQESSNPIWIFKKGDLVFARWYQDHLKWRAGEVIEQTGPVSYNVQVGNELVHKHIDQLRERNVKPASRTFNEETEEEDKAAIEDFNTERGNYAASLLD